MREVWLVGLLVVSACTASKQDGADGGPVEDLQRAIDLQIDNDLGDTTGDLAAPKDAAITTMTIGATGGTITTADGVVLTIPAGALAADTTLTITTEISDLPDAVISKLYTLGPDGTQFAQPVTLTLPYDPLRLGSTPEADLTLAMRTGTNTFEGAGWTLIDGEHHLATGYITHFSQWAIIPSPSACSIDYACWKTCSGAALPNLCCSESRSTCRARTTGSFPAFVGCYAQCVGTPQITNFGTSACMSDCCTAAGWTVKPQGTCYKASASQSQAQGILNCARGCFGAPDEHTLCGSGNIQFDACQWSITMNPGLGGECVGMPGIGVNSQQLFTTLGPILDQIWGNPAVVHVTGGSFDATSISIPLSCATAVSGSGSMTGSWSATQFTGAFSFGTDPEGTFAVSPGWSEN